MNKKQDIVNMKKVHPKSPLTLLCLRPMSHVVLILKMNVFACVAMIIFICILVYWNHKIIHYMIHKSHRFFSPSLLIQRLVCWLLENPHPSPAVVYCQKSSDAIKDLCDFLHSFLNLLMFDHIQSKPRARRGKHDNLTERVKEVNSNMDGEEWGRPWLTSFWGCLWPQAELPPQMLSLFC